MPVTVSIEQGLQRVCAALIVDCMAISPRWRTGALRYPATVNAELVEKTAADHPHATTEIGGMTFSAWQLENRTIRLAVASNGIALTARAEDKDSLDTLKRWAAFRLSNEMRH